MIPLHKVHANIPPDALEYAAGLINRFAYLPDRDYRFRMTNGEIEFQRNPTSNDPADTRWRSGARWRESGYYYSNSPSILEDARRRFIS